MMIRGVSSRVLLLGLLLAACPPSAFAQGGRAEIAGVVLDQGKAVLPGVTVTVTNEGTGQNRQAVTGSEGKFAIPTLLPGTYTIKAELQGFEPTTRKGVVLQVGQEMTVNLAMNLAGVTETITVTGESPVVETTATKIGTNITASEIDNSPSANRSQFSLMQTIPGLVPTLQVGSFEGGQFSANGQATNNNLFLVDGQYDNDSRRGGSQGTQARVSLDSMSEYQVQTHQYGAEYRRLDRRRREQRHQERHQQDRRPRLRVLPGQQAAGDRLLPEAEGRREPRLGQQRLRRQPRRPDRQEQAVLLRQLGADRHQGGGEPQLPGRRRSAGHVLLDDDGIFRAQHLHAVRLPPERQQPAQCAMDS